jgi:acyl-CoA thioester hydrolase
MPNKAFTTGICVEMEDTDAYGMVYHPNFLRYFDRARSRLLLPDFSLSKLKQENLFLLVKHIELSYHLSLKLDDRQCKVASYLKSYSKASMVFDQRLFNQQDLLSCQGLVQIACVDQHNKPKRLPESLLEHCINGGNQDV